MAAEARAMLDALMGSDRNDEVPISGSNNNNHNVLHSRKKKSCYDHDICPFYCAWGTDVYELFTNTKSDIGSNPNVVQEDAREEYLTLPDHEKDRLGYESRLYHKLSDLVRGCDRIVNRNKEKLRVEIAKAARARSAQGRTIDPATDVSDDMIGEAAAVIADLELREEEVADMLMELMKQEEEWGQVWQKLKLLQDDQNDQKDQNDQQQISNGENNNTAENGEGGGIVSADASTTNTDASNGIAKDTANNTSDSTATNESKENDNEPNNPQEKNEQIDKNAQIKELKSKLYKLSSEQQKIISTLSTITSQTIVPLRDNLQNLNKQLYYVKTDTSSDKTVCEVSGNFMSSRDAEERIAAHYAGKQYVGWKMVRDKVRELHKKYGHGRPRGFNGGGGGGPPGYHGGGRGGPRDGRYGGGPPQGYGGGHGGGQFDGRFPGPPQQGHGGPPPPQQQHGRFHDYDRGGDNRRDRSRSRDQDRSSRSRNQRRRSPSPPRWKRDRGYNRRR